MKVRIYEMDQKGYDNNAHIYGEPGEVEEFGEGYTIYDYYSDRCNVALEEMDREGFYYFTPWYAEEDERRYVFVETVEEEE